MGALLGLMMIVIICVVSCSESNSPTAPDPSPGQSLVSFEASFGGADTDVAADAVQARDGGYILVGRTNSFNAAGYDIYIIKLNASGEKQWEKVYGTTVDDAAEAIITAPDFGYVIAGKRGANAFLCKIDETGSVIWLKEYNGTGPQEARGVVPTTDKGYALAGWVETGETTGQDVYVARTDSLGNLLWQKTYGGTANEQGNAMAITPDKGFVVAGTISGGEGTPSDAYLLKVDSIGSAKWYRLYGGPSSDEAQDVAATADGELLIAGTTGSGTNGGSDMLLIRADSLGYSIHQKVFGGQDDEYGHAMVAMADGGCLIAGTTESYGNGDKDVFVVKTDATDQLAWHKNFGSTGPDQGYGVAITRDNGFVVAGSTESDSTNATDMYVVKAVP